MGDFCRVLYISEILTVILDDLAASNHKRALFYLAICSKSLSGPALDSLWADMYSFAPFVPLLPKNVQEIWNMRFSVAELPHVECPPAEEWGLFDTYARRVHHIRPGGDYLDRALYQRLVSIRADHDVFPRLKSLMCFLLIPVIPGVKLFPSSLRSLTIFPEYALALDGRVELALRQAARDAPSLEELHIVGIYRRHSDEGPQTLLLSKLHTVHLAANMLRPADFRSFSRLLSASPIRSFEISLRASSDISYQSDDEETQFVFPHIESLIIRDGPRTAADIISKVSSPHLRSVTIRHRERVARVGDYSNLFTVLAQRPVPIRSLDVRMGRIYTLNANEYVLEFLDTLGPVIDAGLARLTVEMALYDTWKIGDDVKERFAADAWPMLEHFEFRLIDASRTSW